MRLATKASAFVFFSSISAFGTIRVPVLTEAEPCVNVDAYGLTKLIGEKLLEEAADGLPSLSIRLPAVIGRGSKRNWPSEGLRKFKAGAPLDYFNPDAPFNNAVHERDVAALVGAALERGLSGADMVLPARPAGRPSPRRSRLVEEHRLPLADHRANPRPRRLPDRQRQGAAPVRLRADGDFRGLRQFVRRQR